jgi:hemerythrin-like domain-containing protein
MQAALDLTQVPPERQYAALAQALEALPAEGEIAVLTQGGPQPLVRRLIAEHWGRFDWTPVAEEGGRWRSVLRRRAAAPASLAEFLAADHGRCDTLYAGLESAAQSGEDARAPFQRFETAMRRHFAMEEEGWFPQFDRIMGMENQGPTAVMRAEHAQMRGLLDRMALAAAEGDPESLLSAGETLLIFMQQHNMKEEQMLYPMADEALGAEVEGLLKQLALY